MKVPFAPGTSTIEFCPVASTVMIARPVETRGVSSDSAHIDTSTAEVIEQPVAEIVCADLARQPHLSAKTRSGVRLVRTLAAWKACEPGARQRFTRSREAGHADHEVRVERTGDDDVTGVRHGGGATVSAGH